MRISGIATIVVLAMIIGVSGCQAPAARVETTARLIELTQRDEFIDDALTFLREHDFTPDIVDRELGILLTEPSTSGQWFEFWRSDVHGRYQMFEASIHTIRRSIRVELAPRPEQGETAYDLMVQVDKERFSSPQRQVTNTLSALGIYSERIPTREGLLAARQQGDHWVALGRDGPFEDYLLERIAMLAR